MSVMFESQFSPPMKRSQRGKNSFQQELSNKLKERKARGLSADITESEDELASDDELLEGFSGGGGRSATGSWAPPGDRKSSYGKDKRLPYSTDPNMSQRKSPFDRDNSPYDRDRSPYDKRSPYDHDRRSPYDTKNTDRSPRPNAIDALFGSKSPRSKTKGGYSYDDDDEEEHDFGAPSNLMMTMKKPMTGTWGGKEKDKKSPSPKPRKLQTAPDGLPNMSPRDKKWEPPTFKKTSLYDDERGDGKDSRRNRSPGYGSKMGSIDEDDDDEGFSRTPRLRGVKDRYADDERVTNNKARERRRQYNDVKGQSSHPGQSETDTSSSSITNNKPQITPRRLTPREGEKKQFGPQDNDRTKRFQRPDDKVRRSPEERGFRGRSPEERGVRGQSPEDHHGKRTSPAREKEFKRRSPTFDIFGEKDHKTPKKALEEDEKKTGRKSPGFSKKEKETGRKTPTRFGSKSPKPEKSREKEDDEPKHKSILDFMTDEKPKAKERKTKSKLFDSDESDEEASKQRKGVPKKGAEGRKSPFQRGRSPSEERKSPFEKYKKGRKSPLDEDRKSPYDRRYRDESPDDYGQGRKTPTEERNRKGYDAKWRKDPSHNDDNDHRGRKGSHRDEYDHRGRNDETGRKSPYDDKYKGRKSQYDDQVRGRKSPYDDRIKGRKSPYEEDERKSPYDDKIKGRKSPYEDKIKSRRSPLDEMGRGDYDRHKKGDLYGNDDPDRLDDHFDESRKPTLRWKDQQGRGDDMDPYGKTRRSPYGESQKPSLRKGRSYDDEDDYRRDRRRDSGDYIQDDRGRPRGRQGAKERDSSYCEELDREPEHRRPKQEDTPLTKERKQRQKSQTQERQKLDNVIDSIEDAQKDNRMKYIEPDEKKEAEKEKQQQKTQRTTIADDSKIMKPKPRYGAPPGSDDADYVPEFNSTQDIRSAVYREWYKERQEKAKRELQEKKQKEKEEQEKKRKEEEDKKLEAVASYRSWKEKKDEELKEKLRKKRKEEQKKLDKELEEKQEKQKESEVTFRTWKENKDAKLRENHRSKVREEEKKKEEEEREKKNKQKAARKIYNHWKEKKDKDIKHKQRDTINSAKDKEREEKREQRQREREAEERYEEWLIKKEKQDRQKKNHRNTCTDEFRPAFSPAGRTIPFRR